MKQISALELQQRLQQPGIELILLDVREPHEYQHCHIENSQLMPMQSVPQQLDRLPRDQEIVTICHHGMRSQQVAQFLLQQGYDKVINLQGGVDAWAIEVDPTMPRY